MEILQDQDRDLDRDRDQDRDQGQDRDQERDQGQDLDWDQGQDRDLDRDQDQDQDRDQGQDHTQTQWIAAVGGAWRRSHDGDPEVTASSFMSEHIPKCPTACWEMLIC